eukprot:TRINITY_DN2751_c1_g1_i1.p1 TRINITY_DN2751_c1_g1~~TRINITY_DN2751_c1_g1_i1.p1  ORF type:complete len:1454 (+),score=344.99 TRINITY_DN2751_c1_g1_i1:56-4417(+)
MLQTPVRRQKLIDELFEHLVYIREIVSQTSTLWDWTNRAYIIVNRQIHDQNNNLSFQDLINDETVAHPFWLAVSSKFLHSAPGIFNVGLKGIQLMLADQTSDVHLPHISHALHSLCLETKIPDTYAITTIWIAVQSINLCIEVQTDIILQFFNVIASFFNSATVSVQDTSIGSFQQSVIRLLKTNSMLSIAAIAELIALINSPMEKYPYLVVETILLGFEGVFSVMRRMNDFEINTDIVEDLQSELVFLFSSHATNVKGNEALYRARRLTTQIIELPLNVSSDMLLFHLVSEIRTLRVKPRSIDTHSPLWLVVSSLEVLWHVISSPYSLVNAFESSSGGLLEYLEVLNKSLEYSFTEIMLHRDYVPQVAHSLADLTDPVADGDFLWRLCFTSLITLLNTLKLTFSINEEVAKVLTTKMTAMFLPKILETIENMQKVESVQKLYFFLEHFVILVILNKDVANGSLIFKLFSEDLALKSINNQFHLDRLEYSLSIVTNTYFLLTKHIDFIIPLLIRSILKLTMLNIQTHLLSSTETLPLFQILFDKRSANFLPDSTLLLIIGVLLEEVSEIFASVDLPQSLLELDSLASIPIFVSSLTKNEELIPFYVLCFICYSQQNRLDLYLKNVIDFFQNLCDEHKGNSRVVEIVSHFEMLIMLPLLNPNLARPGSPSMVLEVKSEVIPSPLTLQIGNSKGLGIKSRITPSVTNSSNDKHSTHYQLYDLKDLNTNEISRVPNIQKIPLFPSHSSIYVTDCHNVEFETDLKVQTDFTLGISLIFEALDINTEKNVNATLTSLIYILRTCFHALDHHFAGIFKIFRRFFSTPLTIVEPISDCYMTFCRQKIYVNALSLYDLLSLLQQNIHHFNVTQKLQLIDLCVLLIAAVQKQQPANSESIIIASLSFLQSIVSSEVSIEDKEVIFTRSINILGSLAFNADLFLSKIVQRQAIAILFNLLNLSKNVEKKLLHSAYDDVLVPIMMSSKTDPNLQIDMCAGSTDMLAIHFENDRVRRVQYTRLLETLLVKSKLAAEIVPFWGRHLSIEPSNDAVESINKLILLISEAQIVEAVVLQGLLKELKSLMMALILPEKEVLGVVYRLLKITFKCQSKNMSLIRSNILKIFEELSFDTFDSFQMFAEIFTLILSDIVNQRLLEIASVSVSYQINTNLVNDRMFSRICEIFCQNFKKLNHEEVLIMFEDTRTIAVLLQSFKVNFDVFKDLADLFDQRIDELLSIQTDSFDILDRINCLFLWLDNPIFFFNKPDVAVLKRVSTALANLTREQSDIIGGYLMKSLQRFKIFPKSSNILKQTFRCCFRNDDNALTFIESFENFDELEISSYFENFEFCTFSILNEISKPAIQKKITSEAAKIIWKDYPNFDKSQILLIQKIRTLLVNLCQPGQDANLTSQDIVLHLNHIYELDIKSFHKFARELYTELILATKTKEPSIRGAILKVLIRIKELL